MARRYNSSWSAKRITVNFNEKQWRQDLASFIQKNLQWAGVKVSRASKGDIKSFRIFSSIGGEVKVSFKNENEIIECSNKEIIKKYFSERSAYLEK